MKRLRRLSAVVAVGGGLVACAAPPPPLAASSYPPPPPRSAPWGVPLPPPPGFAAPPAAPVGTARAPVAVAPGGGAAEIFVGMDDACVRTTTGEVWFWSGVGLNQTPSRVLLPARAVRLDQGEGTCAVLEDGTVACFRTGELGGVRSVPGEAPRVPNVTNVVAMNKQGRRAYFIRRDGTVFVIETGHARDGKRTFDVAEVPWLTGAEEIASGKSATCARMRDRSVRCWTWAGRPWKAGTGQVAPVVPLPWSLPNAASLDRDCVVLGDRSVRCWGDNDHGQLGDGTSVDRPLPVAALGVSGAVQVSRGPYITCATMADGSVRCWGDSTTEPLLPGHPRRIHPTPVNLKLPLVAEVRVGVSHACARLTDGRVMCWGDNWDGRIGDGSKEKTREPSLVLGFGRAMATPERPGVPGPAMPAMPPSPRSPLLATDIAAGGDSTCAVLRDGTPRCWGSNDSGKLGDGTLENRSRPTAIPYLTTVTAIRPGLHHTCALGASGAVWCWGANGSGQLGVGSDVDSRIPMKVPGLEGVSQLAVAGLSCALLRDGTVRCWGDYDSGAGDPAPSGSKSPSPVAGATGMVEIVARGSGGCGRTAAGDVRCFGFGVLRELTGGRTPVRTALPVRGLPRARALAAGGTLCAALDGGSVMCWGGGQAADVSWVTDRDGVNNVWIPVRARGYDRVLDVSMGDERSCVRDASRELTCWEGDKLVRPGLRDVVKVTHGASHACALLAGGQVYCWGKNDAGQLGDGTTTDRATPVRVDL